MTELNKVEIGQVYNDLAGKYSIKKRESIVNILFCGQILYIAKDQLPHGMFLNFLADSRVAESERTAQRLMSIFRNFGHLLSDPEHKIQALERLGVSHLLELQKLPKRFRKEIELEIEESGKIIRKKTEVIDENKLSEFLEKNVDYKGEKKHIRDLPLDEMRRYINEASGVYEPSKEVMANDVAENTDNYQDKPVDSSLPRIGNYEEVMNKESDETKFDTLDSSETDDRIFAESDLIKIRTKLADFTISMNEITSDLIRFSERDDLGEIPADKISQTKRELSNVKSRMETMMLKVMDVEDKI